MPGGWADGDQRDDVGPPPEGGAVGVEYNVCCMAIKSGGSDGSMSGY